MMFHLVGFVVLFVTTKVFDAFWEFVFTRMWEWLFAQIDWHLLTRRFKLNILILYLDWLLRR